MCVSLGQVLEAQLLPPEARAGGEKVQDQPGHFKATLFQIPFFLSSFLFSSFLLSS